MRHVSYDVSLDGVCGVVAFESVGRAPYRNKGATSYPILAEEFHIKRMQMSCSDGTPPMTAADAGRRASTLHHKFVTAAREGRLCDIPIEKRKVYEKFHKAEKAVHTNPFEEGTGTSAPDQPVHHEVRGIDD